MCGHQQRLDDGMGGLGCECMRRMQVGRDHSFSCTEFLVVIVFMCLLHPRHCLKSFVISFHSHNSMKWILLLLPRFRRGKEAKGG